MSDLKDAITIELNEVFSLSIVNLDFNEEYLYYHYSDWCEMYIMDKVNNRKLYLTNDTFGWTLSCIAYATSRSIKRKTEIYPDIEVYNVGNTYRELLVKGYQMTSKEEIMAIEKWEEINKDFGFLTGKFFHTFMYCKDNTIFFELTFCLPVWNDDSLTDIPDKYSLEMAPIYITISDEYLFKMMGIVNYCYSNFYPKREEIEYPLYGIVNPFV